MEQRMKIAGLGGQGVMVTGKILDMPPAIMISTHLSYLDMVRR